MPAGGLLLGRPRGALGGRVCLAAGPAFQPLPLTLQPPAELEVRGSLQGWAAGARLQAPAANVRAWLKPHLFKCVCWIGVGACWIGGWPPMPQIHVRGAGRLKGLRLLRLPGANAN